jgi:hypothetical protein
VEFGSFRRWRRKSDGLAIPWRTLIGLRPTSASGTFETADCIERWPLLDVTRKRFAQVEFFSVGPNADSGEQKQA